MLSPAAYSVGARGVWIVYGAGSAVGDVASRAYSFFPSVYLNSNVEITSGSGTSSDPYILK